MVPLKSNQMNIRFAPIGLLALLLTSLLSACGQDNSSPTDHEAALPHNLEQTGNTSDAENAELAAAKGKSASLATPADLLAQIKADTTTLLVVNFWKMDCLKCIEMQQSLQDIQANGAEGKLRLLSVNLDGEQMTDGVNLVLRKSGISADTYQVKANDGQWMNDLYKGWTGNLPAVLIRSKDGINQFLSKDIKKEELGALLQPLLL